MYYKDLDIYKRSYDFALETIRFVPTISNYFIKDTLGKQLICSSTSISANLAEGSAAKSRKEFINYLQISLKSAMESRHWIEMLSDLGYKLENLDKIEEIIKILTTIIIKTKRKQ